MPVLEYLQGEEYKEKGATEQQQEPALSEHIRLLSSLAAGSFIAGKK